MSYWEDTNWKSVHMSWEGVTEGSVISIMGLVDD